MLMRHLSRCPHRLMIKNTGGNSFRNYVYGHSTVLRSSRKICDLQFGRAFPDLAPSLRRSWLCSTSASLVDSQLASTRLPNVKAWSDAFRAYRDVTLGNGLSRGNSLTEAPDKIGHDKPASELKKRLKLAGRELAVSVHKCDQHSSRALLVCLVDISRTCKCPELHIGLIKVILQELQSSRDRSNVDDTHVKDSDLTGLVGAERINELSKDENTVALLLTSIRAYELRKPPQTVVDDLISVVNANVYRWKPLQLVEICRDLAWVYRFCEKERFGALLRKCASLVCEGFGKEGRTATGRQIMTVMKAVSVLGHESTPISAGLNNLISTLIENESKDAEDDVVKQLNLRYRRAKGNVHLLNVALISGTRLDTAVVNALLENVMEFCVGYFAATCRVWQLKTEHFGTHDYNTIDPRAAQLLYAKCTNKVLRAPGSLDPANNPEPRYPKLEERYQAVVAALGRLLDAGKLAFCRGLKVCEARLRVIDRTVYEGLNDRSRAFMKAVACFKFEDPQPATSDELYRALRQIGYRPVPMMVQGTFQVNCIDRKRRLYCELCNEKEARLLPTGAKTAGKVVYNTATELKMRCLEAAGWRGTIIRVAEWRSLTEGERVALLRDKLSKLSVKT
ncbi:phosphoadenosine phosphosulfate reductase, putative [Babesia ovata]|uniref:Phosphoadenosine phosphosulfate reductase, putative n=1 Tax=Babesia ovata TaxID=189622 RepID=A0A2H6KB39_9APIC|nr:phosphoadenosine phosphosulfate reductase, putative [Babesia ovata]GBE60179.1 phosphoadenosine phosphosulfate reductase, putative [Babesia ovata]